MFQGTSSDVGKSILCTAFCRYFHQEGYRVAPFKSQNMALNSYITADGKEIGRAQGIQAEAAGVPAMADMNPILLKPKQDWISEVIIHGKHFADMKAMAYREQGMDIALTAVKESLDRLSANYQVLVIEGAGSPAEINLKDRDIANMRVAHMADAPVILVGDIDRGGVFASLVGTLELLEPEERRRVKGFVINKFRGVRDLLEPGIDWLEERTGIPVLGVLPWLDMEIDPEDSLALDSLLLKTGKSDEFVEIAVIRLPHISNFTDFLPFRHAPDVQLRFVRSPKELTHPDALIIPGSKNTMEDLDWLIKQGWDRALEEFHHRGTEIVGICGGFQMLGLELHDSGGIESIPSARAGLRMLPIRTRFVKDKRTVRVSGTACVPWARGTEVAGYEIHFGRSEITGDALPVFKQDGGSLDGAMIPDGSVWGSYWHGLFDHDRFTHGWISHLRDKKGLSPRPESYSVSGFSREPMYDRLADWLREHVDLDRIKEIMEG